MTEHDRDGYQTLEWIISKSESGLFLVVAEEFVQETIADIYRQRAVGIYDCRQHKEPYSFLRLSEWINSQTDALSFFIVNFQLAIQSEQDLKRLNFSRDMLDRLEKNLIFLTTAYGDDKLAKGAFDFYSFIRLRVDFCGRKDMTEDFLLFHESEKPLADKSPDGMSPRQKLDEASHLIERAQAAYDTRAYKQCLRFLTYAQKLQSEVLDEGHPETASIDQKEAEAYWRMGEYVRAESAFKKALEKRHKVFGEAHPDTAASCAGLAGLYKEWGKYWEAEEMYRRALDIYEQIYGRDHQMTVKLRQEFGDLYGQQKES